MLICNEVCNEVNKYIRGIMMKKKKGAMSLEYLAAFVIVIVVVAIIIYWVSSRMSQGGSQIDGVLGDNTDHDDDGIPDSIDTTPCPTGSEGNRDCLKETATG